MNDHPRRAPLSRLDVRDAHEKVEELLRQQLPQTEDRPLESERKPVTERPTREDGFRLSGAVERFVRERGRRVASTGPQQFTAPGTGRVIQDRREIVARQRERATAERRGPERAEDTRARESHQQRTERDDRTRAQRAGGEAIAEEHAARSPAGTREAPLGPQQLRDRSILRPFGAASGAAEGPIVKKPLAEFVQAVIRRFEAGEEQAVGTPAGEAHFLVKTAAQWVQFFGRFLHRTVQKEVALQELADASVFRGLLKLAGGGDAGLLIGDLNLRNGMVEKFARFQISLTRLLASLRAMEPGAALPKQLIAQAAEAETLRYLALGLPKEEAGMGRALRETGGIFTALRTEAVVAEHLGIPLSAMSGRNDPEARATRSGPRGGIGRWLSGDGEEPEATPERFVPWWSWDREERVGLRRWMVPITLGTIIVTLSALALWAFSRF